MTVRNYSSSAVQTALTAPISSSATSITVGSVSGFPISYPYVLSIDADNVNKEIVDVTAAVGTTLTVTRAVDGTAGVAHTLGARVSHDHSARDFRDSRSHENATSNVHGVTGALVGATQTQVLTNKDLSDPSNNLGLPTGTVTLTGTQTLTNKTLTAPNVNDAVYKKNSNALSLPYTAANLAALPSSGVTDGELGATADGKLYQRRSGAWVDIGAAAGTYTTMSTTGDSGWGSRSWSYMLVGGIATIRGTMTLTTNPTLDGSSGTFVGPAVFTSTGLPANVRPFAVQTLTCQIGGIPVEGFMKTTGELIFSFVRSQSSISNGDQFKMTATYAVA